MNNLLKISHSTRGVWSVVSAEGEVDVATSPLLSQPIDEIARSGAKLVVDLGAVSFLDSTGLGVLVQALNESGEHGGEIRLVVSNSNVLKVFEVTALDGVFKIFDSVESAIAEL